MQKQFDLKLSGGKVVTWEGKDGVDAAHRYADANPDAVVLAWRNHSEPIGIGLKPIIEPGEGKRAKPLKIRREKAFPGRYDWQCPVCQNWSRYFEYTCPYCCKFTREDC